MIKITKTNSIKNGNLEIARSGSSELYNNESYNIEIPVATLRSWWTDVTKWVNQAGKDVGNFFEKEVAPGFSDMGNDIASIFKTGSINIEKKS